MAPRLKRLPSVQALMRTPVEYIGSQGHKPGIQSLVAVLNALLSPGAVGSTGGGRSRGTYEIPTCQ